VETSAKCVSVVPADYRERLKNSVQFSSVRVQQNPAHSGRSQAGSWNGMRSQMYFEEEGHRDVFLLPERQSSFYNRYFIAPK